MKLKEIYKDVEERVVSKVDEDVLIQHTRAIIESDKFKDLTVRIPHDIKNVLFSPREVCEWYDKYDCHDDHVTTLFRKVVKNNYPKVWDMITDEKYKRK